TRTRTRRNPPARPAARTTRRRTDPRPPPTRAARPSGRPTRDSRRRSPSGARGRRPRRPKPSARSSSSVTRVTATCTRRSPPHWPRRRSRATPPCRRRRATRPWRMRRRWPRPCRWRGRGSAATTTSSRPDGAAAGSVCADAALSAGLELRFLLGDAEVPVEDEVLPLGVADDPLAVPAELRVVRGKKEEPGQRPLTELFDE